MLTTIHQRVSQWVHRNVYQLRHRATLNAYTRRHFLYDNASISLGDAIQYAGVDPMSLYGMSMAESIHRFDRRVWNAWHEASRQRLDAACGEQSHEAARLLRPDAHKLMPLQKLQIYAIHSKSVDFLSWLYELHQPIEPIQWNSILLLSHDRAVGRWVLDTVRDQLNIEDGATHVGHIMNGQHPDRYEAFHKPHLVARELDRDTQGTQNYFKEVFDFLLPPDEWDWKRRWQAFGGYRVHYWSQDDWVRKPEQCRMMGAYHIPALLEGCPLPIQKILCAFKHTQHHLESNDLSLDVNAKAIRHHFWGGPAPVGEPSPKILTLIGLTEPFSDPNAGMRLWESMQTDSPTHEVYTMEFSEVSA